jgi:hypothetical protein
VQRLSQLQYLCNLGWFLSDIDAHGIGLWVTLPLGVETPAYHPSLHRDEVAWARGPLGAGCTYTAGSRGRLFPAVLTPCFGGDGCQRELSSIGFRLGWIGGANRGGAASSQFVAVCSEFVSGKQ